MAKSPIPNDSDYQRRLRDVNWKLKKEQTRLEAENKTLREEVESLNWHLEHAMEHSGPCTCDD